MSDPADAQYGEYQTARGETRLKRLPPGVLDRRIRNVCVDWLSGNLEVEAPLTTTKIKHAVEAKYDRRVSDNGIDAALRRWGRIGAAELGEGPLSFISFTPAASSKGFAALNDEYKAFRNTPTIEDEDVEYKPNDDNADDWTDAEAYLPE